MQLSFENEETKKLFAVTVEKDRRIFQPATPTSKEYEGLLSQIPPPVAEVMYAQGSNLLKKVSHLPNKPAGGEKA